MRDSVRQKRVLVEGGHFTLTRGEWPGAERVVLPDGTPWTAPTTDTTRACFSRAIDEALALRARGVDANVGLMVGDLAIPAGLRPKEGPWALPASYRELLAAAALPADAVVIWGEAYARNQGKRRLLDDVLRRMPSPEQTYRDHGWALMATEDATLCLVSDHSLDWDGDMRAAVLARGSTPLCPLVFAGLRRAAWQAGYGEFVAIYSPADDAEIEIKLRSACAAFCQLSGHALDQENRLHLTSEFCDRQRYPASELDSPGILDWEQFVAGARAWRPDLRPLNALEREWLRKERQRDPRTCGTTGASLCSG